MHDLDHDIRVWLTREQYLGLRHLARDDERPVSAYVRRLIQRAIDESLDAVKPDAMPAVRLQRDEEGRR